MSSPSYYSMHPVQAIMDACVPGMISPEMFAGAMAHLYLVTIVCTLAVSLLAAWPHGFMEDMRRVVIRLRRRFRGCFRVGGGV